jgi:hypothetical protein
MAAWKLKHIGKAETGLSCHYSAVPNFTWKVISAGI